MRTSFQRGNLGANSFLPSRFPSGFPVAPEPRNPQERLASLPWAPEGPAQQKWCAGQDGGRERRGLGVAGKPQLLGPAPGLGRVTANPQA